MRVMINVIAMLLVASAVHASYPVTFSQPSCEGLGVKTPIVAGEELLATNSYGTSQSVELACYSSADPCSTWTARSIITTDTLGTDLGDASLLKMQDGTILCSYRRNKHGRKQQQNNSYAIEVAQSSDKGATWQFHSTVARASGAQGGLWASFLMQKTNGEIQCYFDDEVTPWKQGYIQHQWLTMKTWNGQNKAWEKPVTVSRAHDRNHLSRDGMCSVVETTAGQLLCVFESVRVTQPWKGCLRSVTSSDGGKTWDWKTRERPYVFAPKDETYNALAPWIVSLPGNIIMCVFVTDEGRPTPDTPSTSILDEDVKAVYSTDGGKGWSRIPQLISNEHPCYLPGLVYVPSTRSIVVQHTSKNGLRVRCGKLELR